MTAKCSLGRRTWIGLASLCGVAATLFVPTTAHAAPCSDDSRMKRDRPNLSDEERRTASNDDDCFERDIHFMPGTFATYYQPRGTAAGFTGGGVQIAPFQWSHNNDRFGPSQGGFYMSAALLTSTRSPGTMALYEVGATASFERNASRQYLIPYFGAAAGGITQAQLGTTEYVYPLAGIHIYWHKNLMLDAEGGYHFPFENIDTMRGPRAQLTARFSLW